MGKTDVIVAKAHAKSEKRQSEVLSTIEKMRRRGEKITFYSVQKATNASKSYLYRNEEIRTAIENARSSAVPRTTNDKSALIKLQADRIKALEKEIANLRAANSETLKEKNDLLRLEVNTLREQLKAAYDY